MIIIYLFVFLDPKTLIKILLSSCGYNTNKRIMFNNAYSIILLLNPDINSDRNVKEWLADQYIIIIFIVVKKI